MNCGLIILNFQESPFGLDVLMFIFNNKWAPIKISSIILLKKYLSERNLVTVHMFRKLGYFKKKAKSLPKKHSAYFEALEEFWDLF